MGESGLMTLNNYVEFDILVANLPRMAKLCFGLFEKRNAKSTHPIGKVTFWFNGVLRWIFQMPNIGFWFHEFDDFYD